MKDPSQSLLGLSDSLAVIWLLFEITGLLGPVCKCCSAGIVVISFFVFVVLYFFLLFLFFYTACVVGGSMRVCVVLQQT